MPRSSRRSGPRPSRGPAPRARRARPEGRAGRGRPRWSRLPRPRYRCSPRRRDPARASRRRSFGEADSSSQKRYLVALPVNLEKELDRLYAQPLKGFTQERDRRVRELRSGGERDAADVLKKARKPTVTAWAANQLVRNERMNVRALLTSGEQLRDAQAKLMGGGKPDDLRRAEESERRAIGALLDAARELVDGEDTLRKLESTLRAAATDPEARELLERGRLTKELTPSGFGLAGMPTPTRRSRPAADRKKKAAEERRKQDLSKARAELQEAKKRAQAAEREAVKTRAELDRIEEQVRDLERSSR